MRQWLRERITWYYDRTEKPYRLIVQGEQPRHQCLFEFQCLGTAQYIIYCFQVIQRTTIYCAIETSPDWEQVCVSRPFDRQTLQKRIIIDVQYPVYLIILSPLHEWCVFCDFTARYRLSVLHLARWFLFYFGYEIAGCFQEVAALASFPFLENRQPLLDHPMLVSS